MAKRVFKSKQKLTGVRAAYRPWKQWQVGDIVVGTYKGKQIDSYDKPNWLIEVEEAFFNSKPKLAAKLKGQILGLNSNGKLNKAMKKVEIGEIVQIEYKGMGTMSGGKYKGKDAHDVEVELLEEDNGDEETDVDFDEDDEDTDTDEDDDDGDDDDDDADDL